MRSDFSLNTIRSEIKTNKKFTAQANYFCLTCATAVTAVVYVLVTLNFQLLVLSHNDEFISVLLSCSIFRTGT